MLKRRLNAAVACIVLVALPSAAQAMDATAAWSITNTTVSGWAKTGFLALVYDADVRGRQGEVHHVVLCRNSPTAFQFLQRSISPEEFNSEGTITAARQPDYFNEVTSVSGSHMYNAFLGLQNGLLEYRSKAGTVMAEAGYSNAAAPNIVLFPNRLWQSHWAERLTGTGIACIRNIKECLGGGRFSVETFRTNRALLLVESDTAARREVLRVFEDTRLVAEAVFDAATPGAGVGSPLAVLHARRLGVENGEASWGTNLVVRYYALDRTFPNAEDLHSHFYTKATANLKALNWNVISNGIVHSMTKPNIFVPIRDPGTQASPARTARPGRGLVVRLCLVAASLAALAVLVKQLRGRRL